MAVDKIALGQAIAQGVNKQQQTLPSNANIINGTARSDSTEGVVEVYVGTETVELPTNVAVKDGDEVQLSVVGGNMVVLGVVGRGDEQAVEIEQASDRYTLTSNAPTISFYPDGTVLPQDITFAAWIQKGSKGAKTSYEGTITIEISADGETWEEFDTVEASSVSVSCVDLETQLRGFSTVLITLYETPQVPEEQIEPTKLATLLVSRVNQTTNYIHENDAGLWINLEQDPALYSQGAYTHIHTGGVDIGADGVPAARIAQSLIELGKGNREAVIDMCNSLGKFRQSIDIWGRDKLKISSKYGVDIEMDDNELSGLVGVSTGYWTDPAEMNTYPRFKVYVQDGSNVSEIELAPGVFNAFLNHFSLSANTYSIGNPNKFRQSIDLEPDLLYNNPDGTTDNFQIEQSNSNYVRLRFMVGSTATSAKFIVETRPGGGYISIPIITSTGCRIYGAQIGFSGLTATFNSSNYGRATISSSGTSFDQNQKYIKVYRLEGLKV